MIYFFYKSKKIIFLFLLNGILFYQKIISPMIPARCRYYPTCSNYGKHALAWHGTRSGSLLLLKRICRCHPLGGHGIDFVPLPLHSYLYQYVPCTVTSSMESLGIGVYRDSHSYVCRLNYLMSST